jgi:hypothetical protein
MTNKQLDAIGERERAASPGPWRVSRIPNLYPSQAGDKFTHPALRGFRAPKRVYERAPEQIENDLAFMAAAREDVPQLLTEIARLRRLLVKIHEVLPDQIDDPLSDAAALEKVHRLISTEAQYWQGPQRREHAALRAAEPVLQEK